MAVWIKKINRFRAVPIFIQTQIVLKKIPSQPLGIYRFFLLSLDSLPRKNNVRGGQIVRMATIEDIKGMCLLENKPDQFRLRFERGEYCVVALDNGSIIGYEWFSIADSYLEERSKFRITIPPDTVYAFDAFIKTEYRLRGLWVQFKMFIKKWMEIHGRKKVITCVDYGNDHSLKTHIRFGFNILNDIRLVRAFGKTFVLKKNVFLRSPDIKKVLVR